MHKDTHITLTFWGETNSNCDKKWRQWEQEDWNWGRNKLKQNTKIYFFKTAEREKNKSTKEKPSNTRNMLYSTYYILKFQFPADSFNINNLFCWAFMWVWFPYYFWPVYMCVQLFVVFIPLCIVNAIFQLLIALFFVLCVYFSYCS